MASGAGIKIGFSTKTNAVDAVDEVCEQTRQPDAKLTALFFSSWFDHDALRARVRQHSLEGGVIGCVTAGEIGPRGYTDRSIVGFSCGGPDFEAEVSRKSRPTLETTREIRGDLVEIRARLRAKGADLANNRTFCMHFIDCWADHEEVALNVLSRELGDTPFFGGCMRGNTRAAKPNVCFGSDLEPNGAVFAMISTTRSFEVFNTPFCGEVGKRLVITRADASQGIVTEINGGIAADEYARAVGIRREDLCTEVFALHPLVLRASDALHVREIVEANSDGSLLFSCAIEEGLVLFVGHDEDLIGGLRAKRDEVVALIRQRPALVVCCDGSSRRIVARKTGCEGAVNDIFRGNNAVGFRSFGEQFGAIHSTHACVGVAIGEQDFCNSRRG